MEGLIVYKLLTLFRNVLGQHVHAHFQKLHILVIAPIGKVVLYLIHPILQLVQAVDNPADPAPVPVI